MVGVVKPSADTSAASELSAAASYLETRAPAPGLAASAEAAADDCGALSKLLVDALCDALDGGSAGDEGGTESAQGCIQVLVAVLARGGFAKGPVIAVTERLASGGGGGRVRLQGGVEIYNRVSEGGLRYEVLRRVVRLAKKAGCVEEIRETVLGGVERFLGAWGVGKDERRALFKECYDACVGESGMEMDAFSFNVKRLELYAEGDEGLGSVEEAAVQAIVDAVRLPKLYRFDTLLEMPAVKRLGGKGGEKETLYKLLSIFVKDDLDVFSEFSKKNTKLMEKHGIDVASATDKMRLLTFASLGIDAQELSYSSIATALHIEEELVEEWVILGISSGLVDAKINQMTTTVAVYRSTQRMFTREEWQPLSERINIWKENISELLETLRETRKDSEGAARSAFTGVRE